MPVGNPAPHQVFSAHAEVVPELVIHLFVRLSILRARGGSSNLTRLVEFFYRKGAQRYESERSP